MFAITGIHNNWGGLYTKRGIGMKKVEKLVGYKQEFVIIEFVITEFVKTKFREMIS